MVNDIQQQNTHKVINLISVIKKVRQNYKVFALVALITIILSSIYIFSVPRYYTTDTKLAPEANSAADGGTVGSIASSLGFDISNMASLDAITPMLYPDLMKDNKFVFKFFSITVKTKYGKNTSSYYKYLYDRLHHPSLFPSKDIPNSDKLPDKSADPYNVNKTQDEILTKIRKDVKIAVDSKTGVITITTTAEDPVVCKILADSIQGLLKEFITSYRTTKARADVAYYKDLTIKAKTQYEKARQLYGTFSDANADVVLESYRSKQNDLENDMQLKYNTYTQFEQQLQASIAKLQEKTPAFTTLKGAAVPTRPSGPKRMIFILIMSMLTFFVTLTWSLRKEIKDIFK
jgi:capsular polysaccharide biosynthesis protein